MQDSSVKIKNFLKRIGIVDKSSVSLMNISLQRPVKYCRFGNICEDLIFANIREFVAS